jgi:hypothetical protein
MTINNFHLDIQTGSKIDKRSLHFKALVKDMKNVTDKALIKVAYKFDLPKQLCKLPIKDLENFLHIRSYKFN